MAVRFFTLAAIPAVLLVGGCSGLSGNDELARYAQRTDRITMSAGDAKEVNAVTHTNNPWPRGVEDRRIVADGARMQRAVERYRRSARPPDPLPEIGIGGTPIGTALPTEPPVSQGGAGGAGGSAGAGGGPPAAPTPR